MSVNSCISGVLFTQPSLCLGVEAYSLPPQIQGLTLRSVVHLELSFVLVKDKDLLYSFVCLTGTIYWRYCLFFNMYFCLFVENQGTVGMWDYLWFFSFIILTSIYVLMTIPFSFYYYSSQVLLEIRGGTSAVFYCSGLF